MVLDARKGQDRTVQAGEHISNLMIDVMTRFVVDDRQ